MWRALAEPTVAPLLTPLAWCAWVRRPHCVAHDPMQVYSAVADYVGDAPGELSFRCRDTVCVVGGQLLAEGRGQRCVFCVGVANGIRGAFPAVYLGPLPRPRSRAPASVAATPTARDATAVALREGYLWKLIHGAWIRRWAVLTPSTLALYKHQTDTHPVTTLRLASCIHIEAREVVAQVGGTFALRFSRLLDREHLLGAAQHGDLEAWMEAIRSAVAIAAAASAAAAASRHSSWRPASVVDALLLIGRDRRMPRSFGYRDARPAIDASVVDGSVPAGSRQQVPPRPMLHRDQRRDAAPPSAERAAADAADAHGVDVGGTIGSDSDYEATRPPDSLCAGDVHSASVRKSPADADGAVAAGADASAAPIDSPGHPSSREDRPRPSSEGSLQGMAEPTAATAAGPTAMPAGAEREAEPIEGTQDTAAARIESLLDSVLTFYASHPTEVDIGLTTH